MANRLIALPEWLPDQSANSGGLNVCTNVIPRVDGYGPIQAFSTVSDTLPAAFRGGASFVGADGVSQMLVGTETGLVSYSSGAWTNVVTGLSLTGRWRFAQFGNYVVSVSGDVTRQIVLTTGATTAISGAPAGVCVAVVGDYVVIGQALGDLLGIYTSGANDHTDWNYTSPTSSSTYQPMLDGGEVMGLAGGEFGVILQRQRLVRMNRTGDATAPFSYDVISPNVGCASKGSVAQAGRQVFFLSERGFMMLTDGQQLTPIGSEKVDRYFQSLVAPEEYDKVFSAVDPRKKLVLWCVPGNFTLIYHYELDRWSLLDTPLDGIFAGFTTSLTLEAVSALYPNIDTMPYSLDDSRFAGGAPRFYAVQSSQVGTLTGANLAAAFEYSFNQFTPGYVTRFRAVRPIGDPVAGNVVTLDCRARMGDAANIVSAGGIRDSGIMPVRASGRFTKAAWQIAAGSNWSYAQGLEFEFDQGGER